MQVHIINRKKVTIKLILSTIKNLFEKNLQHTKKKKLDMVKVHRSII